MYGVVADPCPSPKLTCRSKENGTVNVFNSCELEGRQIPIQGTASPADPIYGEAGVFRVQFPGQPPPGKNEIRRDRGVA